MTKTKGKLRKDTKKLLKILSDKIQRHATECLHRLSIIACKVDDLNEPVEIIAREFKRQGDRRRSGTSNINASDGKPPATS